MHLKSLQLVNFKNYESVRLEFSDKINVLVGTNGSGKTNLLDAIHYLSITKSAFLSSDQHLIKHGEKFFSIKGEMQINRSIADIFCAVQPGNKKVVREGVNDYQKISDHIGKYPVVLIAPDDTELVREGSEERRRFFDSIISQIDKPYLESLIQYNHVLKQRNGLLKMFSEGKSFDSIALETYDRVMKASGEKIFARRKQFVEEFKPVFLRYYQIIVENAEQVDLQYQSDLLNSSFPDGLKKNLEKDLQYQRTNFGIHKDDYVFSLGSGDLKRLGSQGQKKSFIIALKLAHFDVVEKIKGIRPILLLDDIFDKLDDLRIEKLLQMIRDDRFGQLFLTDARPDRTAGLLDEIGVPARIFTVENGVITEE
ncbi:MAG TPA: DNA replication/repair protein RecF [Chryseosolibacter sp.]|nr:DNA replication/repair protein RecF [Chryseosolibacter sp.]